MDCLGGTGNSLCILFIYLILELLGINAIKDATKAVVEVGRKGQLMCDSNSDFKVFNHHTPSDSFPWLQILMKKEDLSPAALPLCQWAVGRAQPPWQQDKLSPLCCV